MATSQLTFTNFLFTWSFCLFVSTSAVSWHRSSSEHLSNNRLYYKNPRNVPSDLCPRDEAQAQLQGRTCLRKCTSDEDCKSKRKKCMCDGACGLSCVKPERECLDPEPTVDRLGVVQASGKMFGSKATYTCPEGYKVIGMEERVCQADGTWSGTAPSCQKNTFCTEPPVIEHARHNGPLDQKSFDLDFSLQYQCLPGYITKGFARTKCFLYNGTAKWFGPDITCEPKSCGEPQDILNGRREGDCFHVGCEITYVCQPGFELVGRSKHSCQADGVWIPKDLPTCVPVQCPIPENPGNGKAAYTTLSFNSVVTYECKYGFMIVGESARRCGPNKRWAGSEPQCKEINCGSPGILPNGWLEGTRTTLHAVVVFHCQPGMTYEGSSDRSVCQSDGTWSYGIPRCNEINCGHPGFLSNGWMENIEHGTALGASIIFRCYDGMTLVGHTSTVCHIDGTWRNPLPSCFSPCKVPIIPFGNVTITTREEVVETQTQTATGNETKIINETVTVLLPGETVPHGKAIGVQCEKHYEASHIVSPPTCYNGTWTHAPKCMPARCKAIPKSPRHGMVIAPKTEHGMKARFTCRDGYILVGNNVTECQYGQWIGDNPFCNQTFCKFPGSIPNGRVLLVGNMGLYDYRNYVTKVANNRQIMFDCDKGYVLADGPQGKTCIRGEWSPVTKRESPRCLASQHPNYRWMKRSVRRKRRIKGAGGNVVRSKMAGGRSGGAGSKRNRKKNKVEGEEEEEDYEDFPQICESLDHDEMLKFEVIQAGEDENQTFSSNAVVRVTCGEGFGVNVPNETIRCDKGRWRPKLPSCQALPCRVPYIFHATLYSGSKSFVFQDVTRHATTVELRCSKGYVLHGPKKLVCWYGQWDSDDPAECIPASCKLPSLSYGTYAKGYKNGMFIAHSTQVDFACDGDFRKVNNGPSICSLGEFKPSKPSCFHPSNMPNATGDPFGNDRNKKKDKPHEIKRACGVPPKERGAISYVEGRPVDFSSDFSFPDSTEIQYRCTMVKPRQKNRWKAVCKDGSWIVDTKNTTCEGDVLESDIYELLDLINGTCIYENTDKHVVTFHNDQLVQDGVEFPVGSIVISRCTDIGKFVLRGSKRLKCVSGMWLGVKPKCSGLSQYNDYNLGFPPTILFRYVNGSIIQSNDGKLLIYEGTTLHMECLWIRKFGWPSWQTSNTHRIYQEGWADDPDRDSTLEYRLTIDNAQPEDSGIYKCITPARYAHEVNVEVMKLNCPDLPTHNDLEFSSNNTNFGTVVTFKCTNGNTVVGAQEIKCLPSGKWDAPLPRCENVQCKDISLLPAMGPIPYLMKNETFKKNETAPPKITILSLEVGGKAIFSCPQGFITDGEPEAVCKRNGAWSAPVPICKEVECPPPTAPENGYVSSQPPYKAGFLAQFECAQNYMMDGQAIIACQDNGKWSRAAAAGPPKCVVSCPYPGTTIGGTISDVKFYYAIGETVTFDCIDDYQLSGSRMLHCMKSGKWSTSVPQCAPYSKDSPSPSNGSQRATITTKPSKH